MELPIFEQRLFLGDSEAYRSQQFASLAKEAEGLGSGQKWYIGSSDLDGNGIFAEVDIPKDTDVGEALGPEQSDEVGLKFRFLTTLARYCNHLPAPEANTTISVDKDDKFKLVALRDIPADEELTIDYVDVSRKIGPFTQMQYGNEIMPYVDLQVFKQKHDENS
jgi:hypothetical protein